MDDYLSDLPEEGGKDDSGDDDNDDEEVIEIPVVKDEKEKGSIQVSWKAPAPS
jgi:hypothetical protein